MNRSIYTGRLLAVAVSAMSGAAVAQEPCEQQVEQLQARIQESDLDLETKGDLELLLETGREAGGQQCQGIVMDIREQLDSARTAQSGEPGAGGQSESGISDSHIVETDTVAVTGPNEVTDAEITTEEPLERRAVGEESGDPAGAQAESGRSPSQDASIDDVQAAELVGRALKTRDGEEVGEILGVARSREDQQLHALVDVGGLLGLGERTVSIPLETAQIDQEGDVETQMSREEIESMEAYDETQFASIDDRVLR